MAQSESYSVELVDYAGRHYREFYARRDPGHAPGWFVFGRNPHFYGGRLIALVARPEVAPRNHPHYGGKVRRGWRCKADAMRIAAELNAAHPDACPAP